MAFSCSADVAEPLLQVESVSVRFGGIVALDHVSFSVERGSICGLIGPNGAGKTTLFNCLSRLYQVEEGAVRFEGRDLLAVPRHGIAALGIGRTFQNLALFRTMSVRRNVMVGGHCRGAGGFFARQCARAASGRGARRGAPEHRTPPPSDRRLQLDRQRRRSSRSRT